MERLEALGQAYFGLSSVFVISLVFVLVILIFLAATGANTICTLGLVLTLCYATSLIHGENRKIALGKGWSSSSTRIATLLMVMSYFFCFGIFGYLALQAIVMNEMKRYGVRHGAFGLRKSTFDEFLNRRRLADSSPLFTNYQ